MRRIVPTCLCLALSGCGYSTWSEPPFSTGSNPNTPVGSSENMRRAMGEEVEVQPLTTEPGDVWPGPLAPPPTLEDIEKQGLQTQPERPVPGSPEFQNQPPNLPPAARRGSSTPPPNDGRGWRRCRRRRRRRPPSRRHPAAVPRDRCIRRRTARR